MDAAGKRTVTLRAKKKAKDSEVPAGRAIAAIALIVVFSKTYETQYESGIKIIIKNAIRVALKKSDSERK